MAQIANTAAEVLRDYPNIGNQKFSQNQIDHLSNVFELKRLVLGRAENLAINGDFGPEYQACVQWLKDNGLVATDAETVTLEDLLEIQQIEGDKLYTDIDRITAEQMQANLDRTQTQAEQKQSIKDLLPSLRDQIRILVANQPEASRVDEVVDEVAPRLERHIEINLAQGQTPAEAVDNGLRQAAAIHPRLQGVLATAESATAATAATAPPTGKTPTSVAAGIADTLDSQPLPQGFVEKTKNILSSNTSDAHKTSQLNNLFKTHQDSLDKLPTPLKADAVMAEYRAKIAAPPETPAPKTPITHTIAQQALDTPAPSRTPTSFSSSQKTASAILQAAGYSADQANKIVETTPPPASPAAYSNLTKSAETAILTAAADKGKFNQEIAEHISNTPSAQVADALKKTKVVPADQVTEVAQRLIEVREQSANYSESAQAASTKPTKGGRPEPVEGIPTKPTVSQMVKAATLSGLVADDQVKTLAKSSPDDIRQHLEAAGHPKQVIDSVTEVANQADSIAANESAASSGSAPTSPAASAAAVITVDRELGVGPVPLDVKNEVHLILASSASDSDKSSRIQQLFDQHPALKKTSKGPKEIVDAHQQLFAAAKKVEAVAQGSGPDVDLKVQQALTESDHPIINRAAAIAGATLGSQLAHNTNVLNATAPSVPNALNALSQTLIAHNPNHPNPLEVTLNPGAANQSKLTFDGALLASTLIGETPKQSFNRLEGLGFRLPNTPKNLGDIESYQLSLIADLSKHTESPLFVEGNLYPASIAFAYAGDPSLQTLPDSWFMAAISHSPTSSSGVYTHQSILANYSNNMNLNAPGFSPAYLRQAINQGGNIFPSSPLSQSEFSAGAAAAGGAEGGGVAAAAGATPPAWLSSAARSLPGMGGLAGKIGGFAGKLSGLAGKLGGMVGGLLSKATPVLAALSMLKNLLGKLDLKKLLNMIVGGMIAGAASLAGLAFFLFIQPFLPFIMAALAAASFISGLVSTAGGIITAVGGFVTGVGSGIVTVITVASSLITPTVTTVGPPPGAGGGCWPSSGHITQLPYSETVRSDGSVVRTHISTDSYDISGVIGDPVYAPTSGTAYSFPNSSGFAGSGNMVVISGSGFGGDLLFQHLSQISITDGQQVTAGQLIGLVGVSGNAKGPHLHYEWREKWDIKRPCADIQPDGCLGSPSNLFNYVPSDITGKPVTQINQQVSTDKCSASPEIDSTRNQCYVYSDIKKPWVQEEISQINDVLDKYILNDPKITSLVCSRGDVYLTRTGAPCSDAGGNWAGIVNPATNTIEFCDNLFGLGGFISGTFGQFSVVHEQAHIIANNHQNYYNLVENYPFFRSQGADSFYSTTYPYNYQNVTTDWPVDSILERENSAEAFAFCRMSDAGPYRNTSATPNNVSQQCSAINEIIQSLP